MQACSQLEYPLQAKVKYLSLEPLLDWDFNWNQSYLVNTFKRADINWLIIGACTGNREEMSALCFKYPQLTRMRFGKLYTAQPRIEWVREIVEAADKVGIPVFLKDNLRPLLPYPHHLWAFTKVGGLLRQEMPDMARIPQFSHIV